LGYTVGDSVILKTADGGMTWNNVSGETIYGVVSVYFIDANTGYAAGGGQLIKTIDGGNTWNYTESGINSGLYSIFFIDANKGYAVGGSGTIMTTSDGGGPLSIEERNPGYSEFAINPNPADCKVTIQDNCKVPREIKISIYNSLGKDLMYGPYWHQTPVEMDVSNFTKGIYFVKIQTRAGVETKKLIIDH
jgi:hypothetical protein